MQLFLTHYRGTLRSAFARPETGSGTRPARCERVSPMVLPKPYDLFVGASGAVIVVLACSH